MISDKDIKKLKQVFATKDDLKGFATKDDLKGFATKDDLKGFATKNDLIIFKDEILKEIENLRTDSTIDEGIHDQVEDHEIRIEKLEKQLNRTS